VFWVTVLVLVWRVLPRARRGSTMPFATLTPERAATI
jgi:hypothetical protein